MPKTKVRKLSEYEKGYAVGHRKGLKEGQLQGFEYHAVLSMYGMKDHLKVDDEFIKEFHDTTMAYVDICERHIPYETMKRFLTENYGFRFNWRP